MSPLDQAWDTALAAPPEDQGPWRVLADMLVDAGDLRGEFMQLELDAERGPLKGLARGRHQQLARELGPRLTPPGVTGEKTVFARGVPIDVTLRPVGATDPGDSRWRTVRRLRFDPYRQPEHLDPWSRTPLTGGQLRSLLQVDDMAEEALALVAQAPPMPRLRRLGMMGDLGRTVGAPPTDWVGLWPKVFARHPALRELELGWAGTPDSAARRRDTLLALPLERVTFEQAPDELAELDAWRRSAKPRFVVEAVLRQRDLGARVELHDAELRLRALPGRHQEAEASLRRNWPVHRVPMPPVRTLP